LNLKTKILQKKASIGIVGLGYVGLPLAVTFAQAGFNVLGFDIKKARVDAINKRESYIQDVKSADITFPATSKASRVSEVDVVCLCVATPVTNQKQPDLQYIIKETKAIARYMKSPQLIILESTTYPGTTKDIMQPILEQGGKKVLGKDFFLAHVPERIDPGNSLYSLKDIPKIIGGVDEQSAELARLLYTNVTGSIVMVSNADTAEMVKVFENTFRNINIAFVNEMLMLCHRLKINIREVIAAASTKPYGYMPFYPGIGPGGHCIPLDPYYLAARAQEYDFHSRFIEMAAAINEQMPYYAAERISDAIGGLKGKSILVLGITYKPNIADTRESPSLKLIDILASKGALVSWHDPFFPRKSTDFKAGVYGADCVVVAVAHSYYNATEIVQNAKFVFDCIGLTKVVNAKNVEAL